MPLPDIRKEIYRELKIHRGLTLEELYQHLPEIERSELASVVEQEIFRGGLIDVNGKIDVKIILNQIPPKVHEVLGVDILLARTETAREFSDDYSNPEFEKYIKGKIKFSQGNRGICVGKTGSIAKLHTDLRLQLVKPLPEEYLNLRYGVTESNGVIHDTGFDNHIISAEQIFRDSRRLGHITYPDGSYTELGVAIVVKEGVCLENQWHTSRDYKAVYQQPYPAPQAEVDAMKAQHRASGSALVTWSPNRMKASIMDFGGVWGSILIYDNYIEGCPDHLPLGFKVIGSHSVFFNKWRRGIRGTEYGYNSTWQLEGWDETTWVPEEYMPDGFLDGFVLLDDEEDAYLKAHTHSLTIYAKDSATHEPVLADIYADGILIGKSPQKFAVEPRQYIIEARAPGYTSETEIVEAGDSDREIIISLDAYPKPKHWLLRVFEWLLNFFKRK